MEMTGDQLIHASQADTWAALNDPDVNVRNAFDYAVKHIKAARD